eukprot:TRINITY_DN10009_c0_g1_i1.p1 TRINITY_DN10009_c0_g1~~TRINITY_DN10009_c0_g1_i1.p1  ORF type:complete len:224 (+),score=55.51 TRINITY_DN10009_c0_g1_i1:42-713(+)
MSTSYLPNVKQANVLLTKDDVGKSKPTTRKLPPDTFVYGKKLDMTQEGAKEVSGSWAFHQRSLDTPGQVDFKLMNKLSLQAGLRTSKEFGKFRQHNEVLLPVNRGRKDVKIFLPDDEFRYGVPNRPSTPIDKVMSMGYAEEAQYELDQIYQTRHREFEETKHQKLVPKVTKTALLRSSLNAEKLKAIESTDEKPLFKLTKFTKVEPRTVSQVHKHKSVTRYAS